MLRFSIASLPAARLVAGVFRRIHRPQVIGCLVAASLLFGAGDEQPTVVLGAPHRPKPWFDAKGVFAFPLGPGTLPATREELVESMTRGWKLHLRFPEGGDVVNTQGGWYPALGSLHIRLSNGIVDTNRDLTKDPSLRPSGKVEGRAAVRDFDLEALPLVEDKAKLNIHITATDARLDLQHDEHGRPMVMLADAKNATFQFQADMADIERVLMMDLNDAAEKYKVKAVKVKLKLEAVNNRSIDVDLRLSTKVLEYVPATMHFQAHVDIDGDMYAKLSHLKCDGDEALGPLITSLIRPGLHKYEGKSRLIFGFPTGDLKLRDVKIQGGDELRVTAIFAR